MAIVRGISCGDILVPVFLSTMSFDGCYRRAEILSAQSVRPLLPDFVSKLDSCNWEDETVQLLVCVLAEFAFTESIVAKMYDSDIRGSVPSSFARCFNVTSDFITNIRPFFVRGLTNNAKASWYDGVIASETHRNRVASLLYDGSMERIYKGMSELILEVQEDNPNAFCDSDESFLADFGRNTHQLRIRLYHTSCPRCIISLIDVGYPMVEDVYDKDNDTIAMTYLVMSACDNYFNPTCCLPKSEHNHESPVSKLNVAVIHLQIKDFKETASALIFGYNNNYTVMNRKLSVYIDYREYSIAK